MCHRGCTDGMIIVCIDDSCRGAGECTCPGGTIFCPCVAEEDDIEFDSDTEMTCRVCGCTETNCLGCVERTGAPCYWVEEDLCSACVELVDEEVAHAS